MTVFRWCLVPVSGAMGWLVGLLISLGLHELFLALCPVEKMISGHCVADWFPLAEKIVISVGAGTAAALIVAGATLTAPAYRRWVAWLAYTGGAVVAIFMGVQSTYWVPMVAALAGGALALVLLLRATSRERTVL